VTGDLQPSTDNATINNSILIISIRPYASQHLAASQHPAAELTQPLSLPPQSLGWGDLWWCTVCSYLFAKFGKKTLI
jgi:hypothetical protein